MRTRQQELTKMLKQKKTNSWTFLGPTKARASMHQFCIPRENVISSHLQVTPIYAVNMYL